MRYFFRVEYDGTRFGGWQRQNNAPSIQAELENAFSTVLRSPCAVVGAGRTDAGVHARAQGAHVETAVPLDAKRCELSVNALLPPEIAIYRLQPVNDDFHARYSARSRRYKYYFCPRKRPMLLKRVWMVFHPVNWERMAEAAGALRGEHDFTTFCASGGSQRHARCTVKEVSLAAENDLMVLTIEANRFVYTMVRSIAGTLIDIGRGHIMAPLAEIIDAKDRRRAGQTAPACGLVLDYVRYEGVE